MHLKNTEIQEELSTMVHLKILLPFLTVFSRARDIPYYMNNLSPTTESVKMEETFFRV